MRKMLFVFLTGLFFLLMTNIPVYAQAPKQITSADIHSGIKKLGVLGSALYVAAHPDDENTRLISYLANEEKVHTTYLSMTRGDGGQNLVGPEMRELLGVIRTNELLMARSVDGGTQMFTRANDFGYSKTPEETLRFWNKDEVLADVVWAIRKNRPDVIITRFPHEHIEGNHGHHTTSAMLAYEAFDLASDPDAYPEQLKYVDVWQPERLFFNSFWWFYGSREKFDELDKSKMAKVDVGVYYPAFGLSNPEIAARSRSMHKSQGFGSSGSRESFVEYLDLTKGSLPPEPTDMFSGIDITWDRIPGTEKIKELAHKLDTEFDFDRPYMSIKDLLSLRDMIAELPSSFWSSRKLAEVDDLVTECAGMYAEAVADDYWGSPGDTIQINTELTNRAPVDARLVSMGFMGTELMPDTTITCGANSPVTRTLRLQIPPEMDYTSPYWLKEKGTVGMYRVDDQLMRGLPVAPHKLGVVFGIELYGHTIEIFRPVVFKRTDPVDGEVYRPFEIVPPVFVNIDETVYMFGDNIPKQLPVHVKAAKSNIHGRMTIKTPGGWSIEPQYVDVDIEQKEGEQTYYFELTPPEAQTEDTIVASIEIDGKDYDYGVTEINYDHIPRQTIVQTAAARVVKLDLQKAGQRIGYIMGAGDEIPQSLEQVGYSVDVLDESSINADLLDGYDAIVLGVRVYNTSDRIRFYQQELFDYASRGGTLITQYNTTRGLKTDQLEPIELQISRTRVADETAPVEFLAPDHPVLHYPNTITKDDFDNWIQERGLYFPEKWSEDFVPILGMNDPGEEQSGGSLLVARYGEGYLVYTGLSMFRELPAGVPGAFRLFTNIISLGKPSKS